jgi:uncharacterized protein (UPF0332 family)
MKYDEDLVIHRRERAKETLRDAEILLEANRLHSSVNRIYYACFYAVTALLHTKGLSSSKHSGIRGLFNEQFVKPGKVDAELGRFYSHMFEFRQKSDYADFAEFEKEKVREWFEKAEQFIQEIDKIIENELTKRR